MRIGSPWLLAGLLSALGCSDNPSSPEPRFMQTTTPVSQDIDSLGKLITLSSRPQAVQWTLTTKGDGQLGPQDRELIVVLRYPADTASSLLATCPPASEPISPSGEAWFPLELKKTLADGKAKPFSPTPFVRSPFLNGWVLPVPDTGILLLYLFTT